MNRSERGERIAAALVRTEFDPPPMYVALLHGAGCECRLVSPEGTPVPDTWLPQSMVVGPFVNPHPLALLGWAQGQCTAGVVARMMPPNEGARSVSGSR